MLSSVLAALWPTARNERVLQAIPQAVRQLAKAKTTKKPAGKTPGKTKTAVRKKGGSKVAAPVNEKDPILMRVVAMYEHSKLKAVSESPEQQADYKLKAKEYSRRKLSEHVEWQKDMKTKLELKHQALAALPAGLRAAAEQQDLTPFPVARNFMYDSPPEAYRD